MTMKLTGKNSDVKAFLKSFENWSLNLKEFSKLFQDEEYRGRCELIFRVKIGN